MEPLCASCRRCRVVRTGRSTFYLCLKHSEDPRFRKYPPMPVVRCAGYEKGEPQA